MRCSLTLLSFLLSFSDQSHTLPWFILEWWCFMSYVFQFTKFMKWPYFQPLNATRSFWTTWSTWGPGTSHPTWYGHGMVMVFLPRSPQKLVSPIQNGHVCDTIWYDIDMVWYVYIIMTTLTHCPTVESSKHPIRPANESCEAQWLCHSWQPSSGNIWKATNNPCTEFLTWNPTCNNFCQNAADLSLLFDAMIVVTWRKEANQITLRSRKGHILTFSVSSPQYCFQNFSPETSSRASVSTRKEWWTCADTKLACHGPLTPKICCSYGQTNMQERPLVGLPVTIFSYPKISKGIHIFLMMPFSEDFEIVLCDLHLYHLDVLTAPNI